MSTSTNRNYLSHSITQAQQDALAEWKKEQVQFSAESRVFQRIKRTLPAREDCDPYQLVTFETARLRYSQAAKRYNKARQTYQAVINPARTAANEMMHEFKRLVESYDASTFTSAKEAREEAKKREKLEDDPSLQAIREALLKSMAETPPEVQEEKLDLTDSIELFNDSEEDPEIM